MSAILSRTHQWAGNHTLTCINCGATTTPPNWTAEKCIPQWQDIDSGYANETNAENIALFKKWVTPIIIEVCRESNETVNR